MFWSFIWRRPIGRWNPILESRLTTFWNSLLFVRKLLPFIQKLPYCSMELAAATGLLSGWPGILISLIFPQCEAIDTDLNLTASPVSCSATSWGELNWTTMNLLMNEGRSDKSLRTNNSEFQNVVNLLSGIGFCRFWSTSNESSKHYLFHILNTQSTDPVLLVKK